ncbi:MAG: DsbA family protein [Actinomycetota bacterium]|nr:DsbA family protein [Actinomycetota bacterium]
MEKKKSFSINFDYRCPFARNLNEHLVSALKSGADYEVEFIPFNLSQVHVEEGERSIWDDPSREVDLIANEVGYIVSKLYTEKFLDVHIGLFSLRHEKGKGLKRFEEMEDLLDENGIDATKVREVLESKVYRDETRELHRHQAEDLDVFGVPTLFDGEKAAFVRILDRPTDTTDSVAVLDRIVDHVFLHPELNEIKHTRVAR